MKPKIFECGHQDIEIISQYHVEMFAEMFSLRGETIDESTADKMRKAMREKLTHEIPLGICKVWGIEDGGKLLAIGGLTITSSVPTPFDPEAKSIGFVHSMYTLPQSRRKGFAEAILKHIIEHAKAIKLKRLSLNGSEIGIPFYTKIGFQQVKEHMRLYVNNG